MDMRDVKAPWEVLVLDTLSFVPKSENGYRFILAVVDVASRWLELLPLRSKDPLELAFVLEQNVFLSFGAPTAILAPATKSEFGGAFPKILKKYEVVKHSMEEADAQLLTMIGRCFRGARHGLLKMRDAYPTVPWDHLLKHVAYKYRTRRHSNLPSTPQKMVLAFKREPNSDIEMRQQISDDATETLTIGAQRDSRMALDHERDWFQTNLERFGGLSLSLKAEALRSKMMPDASGSLSAEKSIKTPTDIRNSPWSGFQGTDIHKEVSFQE